MRRSIVVTLSAVALLAAPLHAGCGYVVNGTHETTRAMPPQHVSDEITYSVAGVSVANDEMNIRLDRQCVNVQEIETQRIEVTERDYRNWWTWTTAGGIAFMGGFITLFLAMIDDPGDGCAVDDITCTDTEGAALGLGLTTLALSSVFVGIGLYYELADHDLEQVLDSEVRRESVAVGCRQPWPTGRVTLMAPYANQAFEGDALGDGRLVVPVGDARREVWLGSEPLALALPDNLDWLEVQIPSSTRTAMLGGERGAAERVYVWFEAGERYRDLLKAGSERVQGSMTGSRRYQFLSDSATRERIEKVVDQGGGSAEARRASALSAARAEDVRKMVQLTITPIFETQVQLSLAVFDTATGDQIYATQAPADLSDAFGALDVFADLADAYIAWEHQ